MSKKLQKRVNGGLAIYFGIGSLLSTILCFVALLIMAYKTIFLDVNITWGIFAMFIFLLILFGAMAYALLRIGYDEIEN